MGPCRATTRGFGTEDLEDGGREFVPTAELVDALGVEPTAFGRQMGEFGCRPKPKRITDDGSTRQVRGYLIADVRTAMDSAGGAADGDTDGAPGPDA